MYLIKLVSMQKLILLIIIVLSTLINTSLVAQDKSPLFTAGGYLSSLQSLMFEDMDDDWVTDNLIHNRLNFRMYAGSNITLGLEVRNRIFTGDMVKTYPDYALMMDSDRGWMDLTWNNIDRNSILFNTAIDRSVVRLCGKKFSVKNWQAKNKLGTNICVESQRCI